MNSAVKFISQSRMGFSQCKTITIALADNLVWAIIGGITIDLVLQPRVGISSAATSRINSAALPAESGLLSRLPTKNMASKMLSGLTGQVSSGAGGIDGSSAGPAATSIAS